jgi:O-antigen/teichoic acid export membrane protein
MSLKKQAVSGTMWTAGATAARALIQVLRLSILTRFLEKSDFGLVAIVMLVLGFTHIFADLGVSVSLFSKQEITKKEYSSLYWVSLLLGLFLYFILFACSPLIASFYHQPELKLLIPVMGLDLIITTAGRQFRVFREKALAFKNLAIIDISAAALSLLVAFAIALKGGGVWSIIFSVLFANTFASLLLILTGLRRHPLVFHINLKENRSFYKIGFYQTGSQILDYIASQLDILIIGKVMSTSDLGVYNLVKEMVSRVFYIINPIITKVAVPLLSTIQEQLEKLKTNYLQMVHIVAFVNMGIYGLMALLAREALLIVYGPSYESAAFIFRILCVWAALSSVISVASAIIIIKGRTDLGFRWTLVRIIANPIFIVAGAFWGMDGIVIGQALYALLFFSAYWKILIRKVLPVVSFKEYAGTTLRGLLASAGIFAVLLLLRSLWAAYWDNRAGNIIVLSIAFAGAYFLLNRKSYLELLSLFKNNKK